MAGSPWLSVQTARPSSAGLLIEGREAICREVLGFLREWFGIPASVESYVAALMNCGGSGFLDSRIS
jgi:hypothetical protein